MRHIPGIGRSAAREYWLDVLNSAPPESPTVPWRPEPPTWMRQPVVVREPTRQLPISWVDDAPSQEWAGAVGAAKYELLKLEAKAAKEERSTDDGSPPAWLTPRFSRRTPLEILNHPSQLLTVKERQDNGATGPWTGRSWIDANPRMRHVVVPAEDPEKPTVQAECSIAPWWDE
ncbi:hypothetical protein ACGFYQ_27435 [Streptomyces sp. NPDC048258]|uniref:hypothetical protein n=1 Tax=Streptomyces sp. NPDC048258 TaxID=3365527 RepID=UPI003719BA30